MRHFDDAVFDIEVESGEIQAVQRQRGRVAKVRPVRLVLQLLLGNHNRLAATAMVDAQPLIALRIQPSNLIVIRRAGGEALEYLHAHRRERGIRLAEARLQVGEKQGVAAEPVQGTAENVVGLRQGLLPVADLRLARVHADLMPKQRHTEAKPDDPGYHEEGEPLAMAISGPERREDAGFCPWDHWQLRSLDR